MVINNTNKKESKAVSFWMFLKGQHLEIPIIQRDYAQGRIGKEDLRNRFLTNIKQALDNNLANPSELLKLDFVYGATEGDTLYPLDGQQRLTTLWLLHWYIALRAKKLTPKVCDILAKFSYETRISSREFCEQLCVPENFRAYDHQCSIIDYITDQTWFYSQWKQDPTIASMLNMLGGTKILDKNNNDILDGIEELFFNTPECEYESYWKALTSDKAPIAFYHLPLKDFGLSDDLYIKMNARGKQLTAFENFKADLIGYLHERVREDQEHKEEWESLLHPTCGIPIKIDTDWSELFWKNQKNNKIDEIFYAFIIRFFWNELFISKKGDAHILGVGKHRLNDGKDVASETLNKSYMYLNADDYDHYSDLSTYKYYDKEIPLSLFKDLKTVLDRVSKATLPAPRFERNQTFKFIPEYADGTTAAITTLNQVHRVAFFALCKYFKDGEYDEVSITRWMRVVWNLISGVSEDGGPQIRNTEAIRNAINYLNQLRSHDVYNSLVELPLPVTRYEIDKRYIEEVQKARKILDYPHWESKIIEAEEYEPFNGSIRFLFQNEDGVVDWRQFDAKFARIKQILETPSDKIMDHMKTLIGHFTEKNYETVLWYSHRVFSDKTHVWMYYLLHDDIHGPVHNLLMDIPKSGQGHFDCDFNRRVLSLLSDTSLLDFVNKKMPSSWIRWYHDHIAIFPSTTGIFLDSPQRDKLLQDKILKLDDIHFVPGVDLLYGSDIRFGYKDHRFEWYRNNVIYIFDGEQYHKKSATPDNEEYFCFNAKDIKDIDTLTQNLDALISELYK